MIPTFVVQAGSQVIQPPPSFLETIVYYVLLTVACAIVIAVLGRMKP